MSEDSQEFEITPGTLVMCRIGDNTVVGPCKVIFVGPDYVTVEDPAKKLWQTTVDRVDKADSQINDMLNA